MRPVPRLRLPAPPLPRRALAAAVACAAVLQAAGNAGAQSAEGAPAIVTELPDDEMGSIPMHAVVPRLAGTPGEIRIPAPALGEHNNKILGGLGLSAGAIDDLRSRKVI